MKYKVTVDFQGYVRGYSTHEVEANSEEEAIRLAPRYMNEETLNIVRDDTQVTDVTIY